MYDFNYHKPGSLADAASAIAGAEDGKLVAGGMTLIPTMKQRLAAPSDLVDLGGIEVDYERRPGWTEDITGCRRYDELPAAARDYVEWLEGVVGAPIRMISVGPDREQLIDRGLRSDG